MRRKACALALVLVLAWCAAPFGSAIAQGAPDQVAETLRDLAVTISEMQKLHELWTAGRVDMNGVIVTFSAEQKTALLSRYTTLKAHVADLYAQLP